MPATGAVYTREEADDPAYPGETPPDAVFPGRTHEPLCPLFEGVVVPAIWSRLRSPLERALCELWRALRLNAAQSPSQFVGMQSGRLVLNAHGWECLCAALEGRDPRSGLPARLPTGMRRQWARLMRPLERLRTHRARNLLPLRLERAVRRSHSGLERLEAADIPNLDTPQLARGPLDESLWAEILLPWFVAKVSRARVRGVEELCEAARRVERALRVEQRFAGELGRRLVNSGVLHKRGDIAYLTVEERIQAVVDGSELWMRVVEQRSGRVFGYAESAFSAEPERAAGSTRSAGSNASAGSKASGESPLQGDVRRVMTAREWEEREHVGG